MQNEKIILARLMKFSDRIHGGIWQTIAPLQASYIHDPDRPIPLKTALDADFQPIETGEKWGKTWDSAWFRFSGTIPPDFRDREVGAIIDLDGEGCVFRDGVPWLGLTGHIEWFAAAAKSFVPLFHNAQGGETVDLMVEAAANTLFGEGPKDYILKKAELVTVQRDWFKLSADLSVLLSLAEALPERSVRRQRILRGLNDCANIWNDGQGISECQRLTTDLLRSTAVPSALTAWSMGHAHIDLAWLWPVRETRRKAGRTFATALRMLERYPEYRFGASQPQLYQWIKEDYPALYEQIRQRIAENRWEAQGASWVEMDTNLTGGESLIRQFLYGRDFFAREFDRHPDYLFLPDCFGFSGALPQILKGCGVNFFLSQKISWNETNTFPHHTFFWEGIDGSRVLAHFLPTNDYNGSNLPKQLIEAEQRYAQNDVSDDFVNLYGVGDGGGGPSADYIEYGLRQRNLEGSPRVRFCFVQDFFNTIATIPPERLPLWCGELYLELHRGTYTTQAKTKRWNRRLEQSLHDLEFLAGVFGEPNIAQREQIWKDTLLHQFHDILPGSSIGWVYRDAEALSQENHQTLENSIAGIVEHAFGKTGPGNHFLIMNLSGTPRTELVRLPDKTAGTVLDPHGAVIPSARRDEMLECLIELPAYSLQVLETAAGNPEETTGSTLPPSVLENDLLRVEFDDQGVLHSIFDKPLNRQWLEGPANLLLLWEDLPNNWGAWDVNHFYRETRPEQARMLSVESIPDNGLSVGRRQRLAIGNSEIVQKITLARGSRLIRIHHQVDWREKHKMLRIQAQPAIHAREVTCEVQFGLIRRPTHGNTSWDAAKFEFAAHRFIDLSQPGGGFAVLNDCKYGHSVHGNRMEVNLLRSPADVDKDADFGHHEFTIAFLPHEGPLEESNVLREAHALNAPVRVFPLETKPAFTEGWFFRVDSHSVKLETVKQSQDGNGLILRLYETMGQNAPAVLHSAQPWDKLIECNLLEESLGETIPAAGQMQLSFKPFQIRTFRFLSRGPA